MALTRRIGLGVTLGIDRTGAANFVVLGAIVGGFTHGGAKSDVVDASILSDNYKPKGKGQTDPGEHTLQIAYDPSDAANTNNSRLLALALADTGPPDAAANFQITYPAVGAVAAATETHRGWVTGLGREVKKDGLIVAPVTITISGDPGFKTA